VIGNASQIRWRVRITGLFNPLSLTIGRSWLIVPDAQTAALVWETGIEVKSDDRIFRHGLELVLIAGPQNLSHVIMRLERVAAGARPAERPAEIRLSVPRACTSKFDALVAKTALERIENPANRIDEIAEERIDVFLSVPRLAKIAFSILLVV
jgi:hypothetical protein